MTESTRFFDEPLDRDQRIRELGLDIGELGDARAGLIEVVKAVVAGRADSTDNNARSSGGFNAWDYGVRRIREVFRGRNDWDKYEENGIEGIINRRLRLKVTIVSTNSACNPHCSPRNRTPKGPATEKIVDLAAQATFFPPDDVERPDGYEFWELCVADNGNEVVAELSRPTMFESNYFIKFSERIFLIEPGEWDAINVSSDDDEGPEIEPRVRRK